MTEADWLAATDPQDMLDFLGAIPTDRKLRLFSCACCRRRKGLLTEAQHHRLLEVVERLADGVATLEDLQTEREHLMASNYALWAATQESAFRTAMLGSEDIAIHAGQDGHGVVGNSASLEEKTAAVDVAYVAEASAQSILLRDIFQNPFRPVGFDPSWRTSTAVAVAQGIYDDKAFDRLPILSDALQDAGCENADLLSHLRSDGPHVRGCWALDLALGKE